MKYRIVFMDGRQNEEVEASSVEDHGDFMDLMSGTSPGKTLVLRLRARDVDRIELVKG